MFRKILVKAFGALFVIVVIAIIVMVAFLSIRTQVRLGSKVFSFVATTKDEILSSLKKSSNLKIVSPEDEAVFLEGSEIMVSIKPRALYDFSEISIGFRDGEQVTPAKTEKVSDYEYKVKLPDKLGFIILQVAGKNQFDKIEITEVAIEVETSAVLLQIIANPTKLSFNSFPSEQALQIKGFYDDNKSRDITSASTGTKYVVKSWKDNVVKVSKNGVVTVVGNGQDAITVTGGSRIVEIPVEVNITNYSPRLRLINDLKDRKIKAGEVFDVSIEVVDQDQNDKITLTSDSLPSFMTFTDNGNRTGVLRLTPKEGDVGLYQGMSITATDNGNPVLSDKKEFAIEVLTASGESVSDNQKINSAPIWSKIDLVEVKVGTVLDFPLEISDLDNDLIKVVGDSSKPSFIEIINNNNAYLLRLSPKLTDVGEFAVRLIAIDDANPPLTSVQAIKIKVINP